MQAKEVRNMAKDFLFSEAVKRTQKKKIENCTPDMDDLFEKIFNPDPKNRLSFSDIRKHPVFSKYFPVVTQACKILYCK